MDTFIWNNGKPQAMRGYNDDLMMSLAIGCWVRDTALTANKRDQEYTEAFFNSITSTNKQFNTTIPGMVGHSGLDNSLSNAIEERKQYMWLMKG